MRSVYAKILLFSFATLVLSLVAFVVVSAWVSRRTFMKNGAFGQIQGMELDSAREAYEEGGTSKLARYFERVRRRLPGQRFLIDSQGRDLLTGENRSALAAMAHGGPLRFSERGVLSIASDDGKYTLIVEVAPPPFDFKSFLPYYALILGAVGLVCWLLAVNIANPLRDLSRTVDRFGAGDLGARVHSARKDEIGELGRAFDRMAERIATLLTAERRLLQDVSHELRTPLARLSFAAELARTAGDREGAIYRMKKEIQRLTDLVEALLEVTRAEGDSLDTALEKVRLDDLLMEVVEDCHLEADNKNCKVEVRAETPLAMRADRELLRRAFENVLRNSIRYAPKDSQVQVELESSGIEARISVRDFGPGVPEADLGKIFQPFFRVDKARDGGSGGIGLGLAIAMRAIGLHNGYLRAENASPGLRVCIGLPLTVTERHSSSQAVT